VGGAPLNAGRWALMTALCGVVLHSTACSTPPKSPAPPLALQLLDIQPAEASCHPGDFYQTGSITLQFDVLIEDGAVVERITLLRSESSRFGASFVDAEGDRAETFWRLDEDGNVLMTAHIDHQQNALTHFEPPLLLWPAELRPNETVTGESGMRVVDSRNPRKLRETGRATRTIAYIGNQRLKTPYGEYVAQRLESRVIADLRLADADERTVRFIVPGVGVVAEQTIEEVKILGAFTTTTRRSIILAAPAVPPAPN
jgi:hypothetical protein